VTESVTLRRTEKEFALRDCVTVTESVIGIFKFGRGD
jgi:hypothetical protein